jgi:hypothetical protein
MKLRRLALTVSALVLIGNAVLHAADEPTAVEKVLPPAADVKPLTAPPDGVFTPRPGQGPHFTAEAGVSFLHASGLGGGALIAPRISFDALGSSGFGAGASWWGYNSSNTQSFHAGRR